MILGVSRRVSRTRHQALRVQLDQTTLAPSSRRAILCPLAGRRQPRMRIQQVTLPKACSWRSPRCLVQLVPGNTLRSTSRRRTPSPVARNSQPAKRIRYWTLALCLRVPVRGRQSHRLGDRSGLEPRQIQFIAQRLRPADRRRTRFSCCRRCVALRAATRAPGSIEYAHDDVAGGRITQLGDQRHLQPKRRRSHTPRLLQIGLRRSDRRSTS